MPSNYTEVVQSVLSRQISNSEDVRGNLERVYDSLSEACLILVFADGRWAWYSASCGYDDTVELFFERQKHPEVWHLRAAGLITQEENDAQNARDEERRVERIRQQEMMELDRLRKKYQD